MVVFLRIFTRLVISKRAGFEDACIGLAMIFSIALTVLTAAQVMNGLGEQSSTLPIDQRDTLLQAFWASVGVYNLVLTTTKVSILVQYLRIFTVRRFRVACFALLAVVIFYGAWAVVSSIFICQPLAFSWNKAIPNGRCMNQLIIWVTNAAVNITLDVIIVIMPLLVVRNLPISKSQRKGLEAMFVLSGTVTLVSIIRLYTLDSISNSNNVSFDNTDHATLSVVEVNVGIICACIPAMRPLFALIMPQYFSDPPRNSKGRFANMHNAERGMIAPRNTRPPFMSNQILSRPTTTTFTTRPTTMLTRSSTTATRSSAAPTRPNTATSVGAKRSIASFTTTSNVNLCSIYFKPEEMPLQELRPVYSRNLSVVRSVHSSHSSSSPRSRSCSSSTRGRHSRTPSDASEKSKRSASREPPMPRLNGHSSMPVTPFVPPVPFPLQFVKSSLMPPGHWMRRPSTAGTLRPASRASNKQLPLTPFPIGQDIPDVPPRPV
ncbi:hypothetical protein ACJQWK_11432 [Exserohilum turcicum]